MSELKTCKNCGKEIMKNPKLSNKQFENKRYCSVKCRQESRSKNMKGKQLKQDNPNWKGNNATNITTFHKRIEEELGKPCFCSICETTDKDKTYDWACLTGKYEDLNDYKRLCRSCHKRYDLARLGKGLVTLKELPLSSRDKEIVSSIAVKWAKERKKQRNEFIKESVVWHEFNGRFHEIMDFFNLTEKEIQDAQRKISKRKMGINKVNKKGKLK